MPVGVSYGIVEAKEVTTLEDLLRTSDERMYLQKRNKKERLGKTHKKGEGKPLRYHYFPMQKLEKTVYRRSSSTSPLVRAVKCLSEENKSSAATSA